MRKRIVKKNIITFALFLFMILGSFNCFANEETTTLYAPDGRTLDVPVNQVEEYRNVGWYTDPMTQMYADDGRTLSVPAPQVEEFLAVGWYTEPMTEMYSLDGRTLSVPAPQVEAYLDVGWYTEPVTQMYSLDDRTLIVPTKSVEEYQNLWWYTEPVTQMYALDGRTLVVPTSLVGEYQKVGWYTEAMTQMYSLDGRTLIVPTSRVEDYKKVWWYTEPVIQMYALDGRTIVVSKTSVDDYKKVGWYIEPVTKMYALDGRTIVVPKASVSAYKKVGWYTTPQNIMTYKKAYAQILESKLKGPHEKYDEPIFSLCYINNDDIPELVYSTNQFHYMGAEVYTFDGSKAVKLSHYNTYDDSLSYLFGSSGMIFYRERENLFTSHYWGSGGESLTIFKIVENKAEIICKLSGDDVTNNFYVNGTKVSFSAYMQSRRKYGFTGDFYESNGYAMSCSKNTYKLTASNIKKVFGN